MQYTTNYQFKMPDQTDNYNIQNENDNWSALDTIIKNLNTSVTNAQNTASASIPLSEIGAANGVAPLDANSLVPSTNLPKASSTTLGAVKIGSGINQASDGTISIIPYSLPIATSAVLGGVKIGSGINIQQDGTISVTQYTLPADVVKTDQAQTFTANQSLGPTAAATASQNFGSFLLSLQRSVWSGGTAQTKTNSLQLDNTGKLNFINEAGTSVWNIDQSGNVSPSGNIYGVGQNMWLDTAMNVNTASSIANGSAWKVKGKNGNIDFSVAVDGTHKVQTYNNTLDDGSGNATFTGKATIGSGSSGIVRLGSSVGQGSTVQWGGDGTGYKLGFQAVDNSGTTHDSGFLIYDSGKVVSKNNTLDDGSGNATFAGTVTATTPPTSDNSTKVATTAFVKALGFSPSGSQTFTSSGTFTVPNGVTRVFVLCVGGGGGGGPYFTYTGAFTVAYSVGGGGGAAIAGWVSVTPGQNIPVTVGVGGAGGVYNSGGNTAGGNGGTSSFGTYLSAGGGQGGDASGPPQYGNGGIYTVPNNAAVLEWHGANGGSSRSVMQVITGGNNSWQTISSQQGLTYYIPYNNYVGPFAVPGYFNGASGGTGQTYQASNGNNTYYWGGGGSLGAGGNNSYYGGNINGSNYGGGGGGNYYAANGQTAGNGAPGIVIVIW